MEGEGAGFPWAAEALPQGWGLGQMPQALVGWGCCSDGYCPPWIRMVGLGVAL